MSANVSKTHLRSADSRKREVGRLTVDCEHNHRWKHALEDGPEDVKYISCKPYDDEFNAQPFGGASSEVLAAANCQQMFGLYFNRGRTYTICGENTTTQHAMLIDPQMPDIASICEQLVTESMNTKSKNSAITGTAIHNHVWRFL